MLLKIHEVLPARTGSLKAPTEERMASSMTTASCFMVDGQAVQFKSGPQSRWVLQGNWVFYKSFWVINHWCALTLDTMSPLEFFLICSNAATAWYQLMFHKLFITMFRLASLLVTLVQIFLLSDMQTFKPPIFWSLTNLCFFCSVIHWVGVAFWCSPALSSFCLPAAAGLRSYSSVISIMI